MGITIGITIALSGCEQPDVEPTTPPAETTAVQRAGKNRILVILDDAELKTSPPQVVGPNDAIDWSPDAFDRTGSNGLLNDVGGVFTSNIHNSADQMFIPFSQLIKNPYRVAFDGGAPLSDNASLWNVDVDGKKAVVRKVHRFTVPYGSMRSADGSYHNVRRHHVTLTLDRPAEGAVVVTPPRGPALEGSLVDSTPSHAIHVCQEGYGLGGPKKGYVGLWLGVDGAGLPTSTDDDLSAGTAWKLIDADSGNVALTGTLILAKAADDPHRDGVNYNGCTVYEADFSRLAIAGNYVLEVDGLGRSLPFVVTAQPLAEPLRLAARYYFNQRSGIALKEPHAEGFTHPRNGHPADGLRPIKTDILLGRYSEGFGGTSVFNPIATVPVSGEADLVATTALKATAAWTQASGTAGALSLVPAGLRIGQPSGGSEYRQFVLPLLTSMVAGENYTLTVKVANLQAGGPGLEVFLFGGGAPLSDVALSEGVNRIPIRATANWTNLGIKANHVTTGDIVGLSLEAANAPSIAYNDDAWGGWHDAGDWDRRIQHMEAVYLMAEMVEHFDVARTLDMNIPESGKPFAHAAVLAKKNAGDTGDGSTVLPDLLHEALWGLSLWRRTQGATGGIIGGVEYSLDGIDGSVSWQPVQHAYAYAEEEWSSYHFARAAAKLGHVLKSRYDATLGQALINEAVAAWNFAEKVVDNAPHDGMSGRGLNPTTMHGAIHGARVGAAAALYRAAGARGITGRAKPKEVFESYNPYAPQTTSLPGSGERHGTQATQMAHDALDYINAGREGRSTVAAIETAAMAMFTNWQNKTRPMGDDFGLNTSTAYPWAKGWVRFGPATNWPARRRAMAAIASGSPVPDTVGDAATEGAWYSLGCNPANVSLIHGLGARSFKEPLLKDAIHGPYRGLIAFGPAAGDMRGWEVAKVGDAVHPPQDAWPKYAAIFESRNCVICSEHTPTSNALEWLYGLVVAMAGTD